MIGIGIDIVEVARVKEKCQKKKFKSLVFTDLECEYCGANYERYAARFAAKEAYMKAIRLGWSDNTQFHEIEVINNNLGAPSLILHGATKRFFSEQNFKSMMLSLSHTKHTAVAVVILE